MKKNSTAKQAKSESSSYAKRQRRRAQSVILATGVYDANFRQSVQRALAQYEKGMPSELPGLLKEADEIYRERQEFSEIIDARMKAAFDDEKEIQKKVNRIEELISGSPIDGSESPRSPGGALKYAIQALLIEFANESDVHVDAPGVAGKFYLVAARTVKDLDLGQSAKRCLRHLDVLLNNPDRKAVKAIIKYWDDGRTDIADPFPAHTDDDLPKKSEEEVPRKTRQRKARPKETPAVIDDPNLLSLREKLGKLELLPENEAIRFQLESEIYQLERDTAQTDEWPDVIGEAGGAA